LDNRDETTWATLELTKPGELKAIEGKLEGSLRSLLGVDETFKVFVPYASYTKGGRTVSVRLIEGYAFVATGLPEVRYFALERSPFVARVFSSNIRGMRVIHTLPNKEVEGMKSRLAESLSSDLEVGARVKITGGNYRDLEGVVVDLYDHRVAVKVEFRSLTSITILPKNLVTFATDANTKSTSPDSETVSLDELMEGGESWL
jgi:transcription antitermination factor NusG